MKKRVIPILIVLAALISLLVLPTNAETSDYLQAGYCKIDIDPNRHPDGAMTGLPMGGYGTETERLSSGSIDEDGGLYATCTAITGTNGTTIIHISVDNLEAHTIWTTPARKAIAAKLKENGYTVNLSNIFITATHSHSTPMLSFTSSANADLLAKLNTYREWVYSQLATAAVSAMGDRVAVTMTKGSVDASEAIADMIDVSETDARTKMNWVRHYTSSSQSDASHWRSNTLVGGSNFGSYEKYNRQEVSSPNDVMNLVQFTPVSGENKPILLVNWAAHCTINSTNATTYGKNHHYDISPDYIGALRSCLETSNCDNSTIAENYFSKVTTDQTYRVSFISSAAGNVVPNTTIMSSSQDPEVKGTQGPEGNLYGQKLAAIARYGLDHGMSDELDATGGIRVQNKTFTYNRQMPSTSDRDFIYALREVKVGEQNLIQYLTANDTNWAEREAYYGNLSTKHSTYLKKFSSRHLLRNMDTLVRNHYDYGLTSGTMTVSAIAIGTELAITVNPCELFDRYSDEAKLDSTNLNDWDNLNNIGSFGTPLVMGYTNGYEGYLPNSLAYNYNSGRSYSIWYSGSGDGADYNDIYITGSYESSGAVFEKGTGEDLVAFYKEMLTDITSSTTRIQCECGGKAEGVADHVCSNVEFLPWTDSTSLPTGGNYYLETDVTLNSQVNLSSILSLDLNGHTITHNVAANETENSRVFYLSGAAHLSITDSTSQPGTITRQVPADHTTTSYGLIVSLNENSSAVLYDGILKSTDFPAGGGGCVSVNSANAAFKMYGGQLLGAKANVGSVLYVNGSAELYGGTLTGGVSPATWGSGIWVDASGKLAIGGTARIENNKNASGTVKNINFAKPENMPQNFTVSGNFTGKAGVIYTEPTVGQIIGKSDNASFTTENLVLDNNPNFVIAPVGDDIVLLNASDIKNRCECASKAEGKPGHKCETIEFLPWSDATSLPTYGNYYLTTSVTTDAQVDITGNLRLDLNGNDITRTVLNTTNPRVFAVNNGGYLSITDSTNNPGSVKRDVTNLSGTVTNYGLIILILDGGNASLYNGHLDSTGGQTTGGGGCVSSNNAGSSFTMYGGQMTGATATDGSVLFNQGTIAIYDGSLTGAETSTSGGVLFNAGTGTVTINGGTFTGGQAKGGVLYNSGTITINDGTFTGGKHDDGGFAYNTGKLNIFGGSVTDNRTVNNGIAPGVYCASDGKLTIGGTVEFSNNRKYEDNGATAKDVLIDIRFADATKMATNFTVRGAFTGKAGFYIDNTYRTAGFQIGVSDNASFAADNLFESYYTEKKDLAINGNMIIFARDKSDFAATIINGATETNYITLGSAVSAYTGGNAVLTLQQDSSDTVTFDVDTILDLNGCSLTGKITANGKLTVKDSQTDDLTIEDDKGYGKLPASLSTEAAKGYIKITESDGVSFHKLILETESIGLRASSAGIYYVSTFGGDEVIKENIIAYGTALGANKEPDFDNKTYTAIDPENWSVGMSNQNNGTILQGIMKEEGNGYSANMYYASVQIYGLAYIQLREDNRIITETEFNGYEESAHYSLRNIIEGFDGFDGADDLWDKLSKTQQEEAVAMYKTYEKVMQNWDIPNIKGALING